MRPPAEPRVTVVMPVHDGERFVAEAVDSILRQTLTELDFVIVDDGSSDRSVEVIRSYDDPRIRLIENESNRGLVETLNRGVSLASSPLIARMDADDVAMPSRLARQASHLESHPSVVALSGAMQVIDGDGALGPTITVPTDDESIRRMLAEGGNPLHHPASMFRKSAFDAVGGYRGTFRHAEDLDLWLRLAEAGELANLAEVVLRYRMHAAQVSFVHVVQQVVSAAGAVAAARERRAKRADPFEGVDLVRRSDLSRLGVDLAEVECQIVERLTATSQASLAAGRAREALEAAEALATADLSCRPVARDARFEANWLRWKSYWAIGERGRGLASLLRALPWSAGRWFARLGSAIWRRLPVAPPSSRRVGARGGR